MMKILFPILILTMAIISLSCQNESFQQEDLALNAAKDFFKVTNVTVEDSKQLYLHYCAVCHGEEGKGDGFNAYNLDPKPKSFTDSTFLNKVDSAYVINVIKGGGKAVDLSNMMPPYGRTLTEEEIREVAEYVIFLSKNNAD